MPIPHLANPAEELLREQQLLSKTDTDIEQGWNRLRDQQDLVSKLQTSGRDIRQAERLMQLTKQTLVEWERHRRLIEQRIAHLERAVAAP